MKYFKFYVEDFIIGTNYMTPEEVGLYVRMLCFQFDKGKLTNDKKRLSQMFGGEITDEIISKFQVDESGMLFNKRLLEEKEKASDKIEKLKQNGLKGALKKWKSPDVLPEIDSNVQYKFKIRDEKVTMLPSEYIKTYHISFLELLLMRNKFSSELKESILSDVFSSFDTEYHFYDFSNQNHVKNAFKSIFKKKVDEIQKQKPKFSIHGSTSFD